MSVLRTKVAIQHADSFILNSGGAQAPSSLTVLETETGARTLTGGSITTKSSATTARIVNIGDIVKYVNLFIECGPRATESSDEKGGWLEWAFVCVKESETALPITDMGIITLGTAATGMYRNECIFTGAFPVGTTQPNYLEIKIKIPKFKQNIRIGDQWRFVTFFRPTISTATQSDAVRLMKSFMYKSYS